MDEQGNTESVGVIVTGADDEIILKAFILKEEDSNEKENFIKILSTSVCNFVCIAKPDEFVAARKNYELGLDPSKIPRRTSTLSRLLRRSGLNIGQSPSRNKETFRIPAPPSNEGQTDLRASTFSLASSCSSMSTVAGSHLNESEIFASDMNNTMVPTPTYSRRRETFAERVNNFLSNLGQCTPQSSRRPTRVPRSFSTNSPNTNLKHSSSSTSSSKGK